jgi:hypothetical protein
MFARDKYNSLLQKFINHGRKKFYNIAPWAHIYKPFFYFNSYVAYLSKYKPRSLPYKGS